MAESQHPPHKLTLNQRRELTVTGISEVVSFDEGSVVLRSGEDILLVQGQALQLKQLAPEGGTVAIEGHISALTYEAARPAGSWLSRIFR